MRGLSPILLLLACLPGAGQTSQIVSVTDAGAVPDLAHGEQNRQAFLNAFLQARQVGKVVVPPGTYGIDNSAGPLFIQYHRGEFLFEGGATLSCLDNTKECLRLDQWESGRIEGLHVTYASPAVVNSGNYGVIFSTFRSVSMNDVTVENAGSVGFQIYMSYGVMANNIVVRNTLDGGLQVRDSRFVQLNNVTTENTGNDGLAFILYGGTPDAGLHDVATNVTVHSSGGNGIKVGGGSAVVVDGFVVDGTGASGVICDGNNPPFYGDATPRDVSFSHGVIRNVGAVSAGSHPGNTFGVEFESPASCSFSHIQVAGSQTSAVSVKGVGGTAPAGTILLSDIHVTGGYPASDADGFNVGALVLNVSDCVSENAPGAGFYFTGAGTLMANNLTSINASQANSSHYAFWFGGSGFAAVTDLKVIDTQAGPTGTVIGGAGQSGVIDGVITHLSGGGDATYSFLPGTFDVHNEYGK